MSSSAGATKLRAMVVLGSTRTASPPWGGPARLGDRVAKFIVGQLDGAQSYEVDYVDLLKFKLPLRESYLQ